MNKYGKLWRMTALAMCMAPIASSLAQATGVYYEATAQEQGKRTQKWRGWVDGDHIRVEFRSGKKGPFASGNYLVSRDGGKTVYLVNLKDKTYGEFDVDRALSVRSQFLDKVRELGGPTMEYDEVYNQKLLEESGEPILGHSTTHYRFEIGYTMRENWFGTEHEYTVETVQDIWSTDDFGFSRFAVLLRPDRIVRTGDEGHDKLLNSALSNMKGFPLKTVALSTTTNEKGKSKQKTYTTEVKVLREESIPASTFEWPSDYAEAEIIPDLETIFGADEGVEANRQ